MSEELCPQFAELCWVQQLLVFLQGSIVLSQDLPSFGGHEAIRGILSAPSQFPHPCSRDKVKLCMPEEDTEIKNSERQALYVSLRGLKGRKSSNN